MIYIPTLWIIENKVINICIYSLYIILTYLLYSYIIHIMHAYNILWDLTQIFVTKKCLRRHCPEEQYTCNKEKKILDFPDKVILRHTEVLEALN